MRDIVFVDTNILIYAHDTDAGPKRQRAIAALKGLWESGNGRLSVQVLQDFYLNVTRKLTTPVGAHANHCGHHHSGIGHRRDGADRVLGCTYSCVGRAGQGCPSFGGLGYLGAVIFGSVLGVCKAINFAHPKQTADHPGGTLNMAMPSVGSRSISCLPSNALTNSVDPGL